MSSELTYGKIMHLVNTRDFDLVKEGRKTDITNYNDSESDEIRMKKYNEDFIRNQAEEKFKENIEWGKLGDRLKPILHSTSTVKDTITEAEIINDTIDLLPLSFQKKGRQFIQRLLKDDGISIDKNYIYIEKNPLQCNIIDVIGELVRPRNSLSVNLDQLLRYLMKVNFPKSLIFNKEVLDKLKPGSTFQDESIITMSSTPVSKKKRKRRNESTVSTKSSGDSLYDDPMLADHSQNGSGGRKKVWVRF